MDIRTVRKLNLISLIGDIHSHGAVAEFARKYNLDPTYVRQIIHGHRNMGEKAARNFEEALKIERMTLDQGIGEPRAQYGLSDKALMLARVFDSSSPELQEAALRMLGALRDIDNEKHE